MKWLKNKPKHFTLKDYDNYYNQFTNPKILEKYKIWFADEMRFCKYGFRYAPWTYDK